LSIAAAVAALHLKNLAGSRTSKVAVNRDPPAHALRLCRERGTPVAHHVLPRHRM